MRRFAWMGLVALAGLGGVSCSDALEDKEVFVANLSGGGGGARPAAPAANGTAQIIVEGNQITYAIEVDDITSIIQRAHPHRRARRQRPRPPVPVPGAPGRAPAPLVTVTDKTILVEATVDSSLVNGVTYEELLAAMRSGNAYVNVHTTQFPGGEIRGPGPRRRTSTSGECPDRGRRGRGADETSIDLNADVGEGFGALRRWGPTPSSSPSSRRPTSPAASTPAIPRSWTARWPWPSRTGVAIGAHPATTTCAGSAAVPSPSRRTRSSATCSTRWARSAGLRARPRRASSPTSSPTARSTTRRPTDERGGAGGRPRRGPRRTRAGARGPCLDGRDAARGRGGGAALRRRGLRRPPLRRRDGTLQPRGIAGVGHRRIPRRRPPRRCAIARDGRVTAVDGPDGGGARGAPCACTATTPPRWPTRARSARRWRPPGIAVRALARVVSAIPPRRGPGRPVGDGALTVELGDTIDPVLNARVRALDERLRARPSPGLARNRARPTGRCSWCTTRPRVASRRWRRRCPAARIAGRGAAPPGRRHVVPTRTGARTGPTSPPWRARCGLSEARASSSSTPAATTWRSCSGFTPGFAYLGPDAGEPGDAAPGRRRACASPPGAVGVAGRQTGDLSRRPLPAAGT